MAVRRENVVDLNEDATEPFIKFYPKWAKLLGSVEAALFFQQVLYRAEGKGWKPFYKFQEPCSHERYTPGDSWIEELGFGPAQFRGALKKVATRIWSGVSKYALMEEAPEFDATGRLLNANRLVLYWRDGSGLTWWEVNEPFMEAAFEEFEQLQNAADDSMDEDDDESDEENGADSIDYSGGAKFEKRTSIGECENRTPIAVVRRLTCENRTSIEKNDVRTSYEPAIFARPYYSKDYTRDNVLRDYFSIFSYGECTTFGRARTRCC